MYGRFRKVSLASIRASVELASALHLIKMLRVSYVRSTHKRDKYDALGVEYGVGYTCGVEYEVGFLRGVGDKSNQRQLKDIGGETHTGRDTHGVEYT